MSRANASYGVLTETWMMRAVPSGTRMECGSSIHHVRDAERDVLLPAP